MASVQDIVDLMNEMIEDQSAPKNLKARLQNIISILKTDESLSMRLNKASHALDEIASNNDIDSYTRTQLLGVVGALETVEE